MGALICISLIYLFILIGFIFKRIFKEQVSEKTLVLLNLYFLSPLLIFWGITRASLNSSFINSLLVFSSAIFITLFIAYLYTAKKFSNDDKDKSIFLASSLVGNTGNLGIPLCVTLFGEESAPYAAIVHILTTFFMYIFSVYFLTGKGFNLLNSLKNIFKLPPIHAAIMALIFNAYSFKLSDDFDKVLNMGAHSSIVIQLIIFGIFMSQTKIKTANWKLAFNTILFKHFILPMVTLVLVLSFTLNPIVGAVIFLELSMPLAVNNINLTTLYDCKPIDTTFAVLSSSVLFIILLYAYVLIINEFFGYKF